MRDGVWRRQAGMRRRCHLAGAVGPVLAGLVLLGATLGSAGAGEGDCAAGAGARESVRVEAVMPDGTLRLADGRQVMLAGVHVSGEAESQLVGKPLEIAPLGQADRWGRRTVLGWSGEGEALVQQSLVSEGLAAVWGEGVPDGCAEALLTAESAARAQRNGLWGGFAAGAGLRFTAARPEVLQSRAGRFAIVEGRVESLGKTRDTRYLNFGRHWATDFTVTFNSSIEGQLAAAGFDLARIDGSRVRVRGVVLMKNGPHIEVTDPAQIEWAD
ncbi:thermonuclease family protein [Pannonibacter sp. SL95]|uniref:thermonuclease family protein n=1 Tax=Pannonibacter sp. SL95 TaxID=2995153 RepID=UPI00227375C4|nr:thermonuclease family protein [Pannonibacter sp. SL95]MCY1704557.1 thermonuclease family protein [Pannonibacter sp. SL95]